MIHFCRNYYYISSIFCCLSYCKLSFCSKSQSSWTVDLNNGKFRL